MIISVLLIILSGVLLVGFLWERQKRKQTVLALQSKSEKLESVSHVKNAILKNVHAYILLIDSDFNVLESSYNLSPELQDNHKYKKVGDLLRCVNALNAAGGCGTHELCAVCPARSSIQKAFDEKQSSSDMEIRLKLIVSDNKVVECDTLLSGAYLLLNGNVNMVLTIHDITSLKKVEHELIRAKEKAEDADRSKSAFLANMSHEIRTPLNAITGFSELLANATVESEKMQYQEIIKMNADLLLQLVNDILDLSKIEAGTLEFVYSEVNVNQLIFDLKQLFRMKIEMNGGKAKVETRLGLPSCVISTDKNRIAQVLSNFVSNAIKFTSEGSITIGYEVHESELYFYVTDTGEGISEENQKNLFDRFVTLRKDKAGTGLGLPISKTIVEKLNGKIGVDSTLGKGSTFWFTLPYDTFNYSAGVEEKNETLSNKIESASQESTEECQEKRFTILVAEDIEDNYRLCEAILSSKYDLLWAHNGEEAVSLYLQHQPDLILMDLRMPQVDGYEATQAIRQTSVSVPIIALTAFAYPEDRQKVMESGFTDFMTKPVSAKILLGKLDSILMS